MMKPTKKERMYRRIQKHGEQLNAIFKTPYAPIELCKKLRRIETKQHKAGEDYCNGYIDSEQFDKIKIDTRTKLVKLLGDSVPVMINGDPRGYALKIDDSIIRERDLDIMTDWGGYGLLAPDLTED